MSSHFRDLLKGLFVSGLFILLSCGPQQDVPVNDSPSRGIAQDSEQSLGGDQNTLGPFSGFLYQAISGSLVYHPRNGSIPIGFQENAGDFALSADGKLIAVVQKQGNGSSLWLFDMSAEGPKKRPLPLVESEDYLIQGLRWSSDGTTLLYSTAFPDTAQGITARFDLNIIQLDPLKTTEILSAGSGVGDYRLSLDNQTIAISKLDRIELYSLREELGIGSIFEFTPINTYGEADFYPPIQWDEQGQLWTVIPPVDSFGGVDTQTRIIRMDPSTSNATVVWQGETLPFTLAEIFPLQMLAYYFSEQTIDGEEVRGLFSLNLSNGESRGIEVGIPSMVKPLPEGGWVYLRNFSEGQRLVLDLEDRENSLPQEARYQIQWVHPISREEIYYRALNRRTDGATNLYLSGEGIEETLVMEFLPMDRFAAMEVLP